jgi:hypothetical protein
VFVEQNANDTETRNRFDRFRQAAERLQQDPQSGAHAGTVRDVFTSAVEVFESSRIDAGDVSRLRQTAASISADQPLLEQSETVKQFPVGRARGNLGAMFRPTDDLRITQVRPLIPPAILLEELPITERASHVVSNARTAAAAAVAGGDPRLVVIAGPCSIHDDAAALDYAGKLKPLATATPVTSS